MAGAGAGGLLRREPLEVIITGVESPHMLKAEPVVTVALRPGGARRAELPRLGAAGRLAPPPILMDNAPVKPAVPDSGPGFRPGFRAGLVFRHGFSLLEGIRLRKGWGERHGVRMEAIWDLLQKKSAAD